MTKPVDRKKSQNYLTKAENLLEVARYALSQKKYDAVVINAVHSAINALDALTTQEKGLRASGEHDEVLLLIKGILVPKEYDEIKKQFSSLRNLKNTAEYQPDFMSPEEAKNSIKWSERILDKVKIKLES
ncbi:MAG TPA: HEPN domain-containing protein [Candidatus Nitrosotenuis sp.]